MRNVRRRLAAIALAATAAAFGGGPALAVYDDESAIAERDPDFAAGMKAVQGKSWEEAARRFALVALREPENADVHNMLGYSHRNAGRYELAFKHYEQALALDPRHKGAHEYIGETYLKVGNVAAAEKHAAELQRLCPMSCEPLKDLERAIADFRGRK
jgi:Flp pilus assembly protein TadD